jgi:hypothetical protein
LFIAAMSRAYGWSCVIEGVLHLSKHQDLKVMKGAVPHPLEVGFKASVGGPAGQRADYRLSLPDGRGIHVREYEDYYLVHWDGRDPSVDPIGHVMEDAPHLLAMPALALAGLIILVGARRGSLK